MEARSYDMITVGGGIAASTLAKAMAGRGAKVLVLEREKQFKDRVRGEAVVPWGVAEANELGICRLLKEKCAHDVPFVEAGSGLRDLRATPPQQLPLLSFPHLEPVRHPRLTHLIFHNDCCRSLFFGALHL
jgi:menaquinone-9 beta-reductase